MKLGRRMAGKPGLAHDGARLFDRVRDARARAREADLLHRRLEERAVLGLGDRVGPGAEHLDAEALEHPLLAQLHREVERRLAAERGQEGLGPLALDDGGQGAPLERLDVRARRELRVGHDRRRVRVHQDDVVPLLAQRLGALRARVVELARLPDDDGARADEEDALEVGAAGHTGGGLAGRGAEG